MSGIEVFTPYIPRGDVEICGDTKNMCPFAAIGAVTTADGREGGVWYCSVLSRQGLPRKGFSKENCPKKRTIRALFGKSPVSPEDPPQKSYTVEFSEKIRYLVVPQQN